MSGNVSSHLCLIQWYLVKYIISRFKNFVFCFLPKLIWLTKNNVRICFCFFFPNLLWSSFVGGSHNLPASFHWCPCKTLKTHKASSLFVPRSQLRGHPICVKWIPSCSLYVVGHPESHYWNLRYHFPLQEKAILT